MARGALGARISDGTDHRLHLLYPFVKAPTMEPLMRRLKLQELKPYEEIEYYEGKAIIYVRVLADLAKFFERGYIDKRLYKKMQQRFAERYADSCTHYSQVVEKDEHVVSNVLRLYAIGIEKQSVRNLFAYNEVSEQVYKKVLNKLNIQLEQIEKGYTDIQPFEEIIQIDWFEWLLRGMRKIFHTKKMKNQHARLNKYMYFRALAITARKVQKELARLDI